MKVTIRTFVRTALVALALSGVAAEAGAEPLAKDLFGAQRLPAATAAKSYGFYSKGCFSGGMAIATDGPNWQAMRLSRNRRWGHPALVSLIEQFSRDAAADGWPGLLIGDMSQPRGGPMLTGHASHQIGLDADIWLTPMPNHKLSASERENMSATLMVNPKTHLVYDKLWTEGHTQLIKRAASYSQVERILVNPGIKKKLCDTVTGNRAWLGKVRPFWGHDYHMHVRIGCQPGSVGCKAQDAVPRGDGCDKSLAWWFTEEPWRPNQNPDAPKARDVMKLSALPKECRMVLGAPSPESEMAATYHGGSGASSNPSPNPSIASVIEQAETAIPRASAGSFGGNAYLPADGVAVPLPKWRPQE